MGLPVSKYDWWILAAAFALFAAWLITRLPVLRTLALPVVVGRRWVIFSGACGWAIEILESN